MKQVPSVKKSITIGGFAPLPVKPGLVRVDWILEGAQRLIQAEANELAEDYRDRMADAALEYVEEEAEYARFLENEKIDAEQERLRAAKEARNARDRARRAARKVAA